jgi:YcaO-like protein with predicted kinase domain
VARAGIARISDLTPFEIYGLRRVAMAVRPAAAGYSICIGHGQDEANARASAMLAAVERARAEQPPLDVRLESALSLGSQAPLVDPQLWATRLGSTWSPERVVPWVRARELLTGATAYVPLECVRWRPALPELPGGGNFLAHPTGLAAGATEDEALLFGLLEVIERDADQLYAFAGRADWQARRLSLEGLDTPLLTGLRAHGEQVRLYDLTRDVAVPVVRAMIGSGPCWLGVAAHVRREHAVEAALAEAIAARAEHEAGGPLSTIRRRTRTITAERAAVFLATDDEPGVPPPRPLTQLPAMPQGAAPLAWVLAQLRAAGRPHVLGVRLDAVDEPGPAVVRALVPGLELPRESSDYVRGPRTYQVAP